MLTVTPEALPLVCMGLQKKIKFIKLQINDKKMILII